MIPVLIVDADRQVQRALSRLFQSRGFECATAATIGEALEATRNVPPSVVILDISLGLEPGLELQHSLRALDRSVPPVVFVTTRRDQFDALGAQVGPADDWVLKPWDAAELLARVRLALRRAA